MGGCWIDSCCVEEVEMDDVNVLNEIRKILAPFLRLLAMGTLKPVWIVLFPCATGHENAG